MLSATRIRSDLLTLLDPDVLDIIGPAISDAVAAAETQGDQQMLRKLLIARHACARLYLAVSERAATRR
jgi:hypothetical protein